MDTTVSLNQYLTFKVDNEKFALNVANVREVLEFTNVTKVPRMPPFMKGVINLRGSVVPVIDLRLKFGLDAAEQTIDTSIVVAELKLEGSMIIMGLLTDSVEEVLDLMPESIEPPPKIGTAIDTQFIHGMGKVDDDFVIILNIDCILNETELDMVSAHQEEAEG